jgi:hypothetical protein
MRESWRAWFLDFAANLLIFSTSTHTHDFGKHSDGYGYSKAAFVQSLVDSQKSHSSMVLNFNMVLDSIEIYDF